MPECLPALSAAAEKQLLADVFHALNQPLTGLRCALELSLEQPRSPEQLRDTLRTGLWLAEQIARLSSGLREWFEANDAGDHLEAVQLDQCLRDAISDWQPIAESLQVELRLQSERAFSVLFEPRRLRRALFYLLEFALNYCPACTTVKLAAREQGGEAAVSLVTSSANRKACQVAGRVQDKAIELERRLSLAIARRIFESGGGNWRMESNADDLRIEIRCPLAATADGAGQFDLAEPRN